MQLYLVQHGKAMSKDENPDRPLTEEGRAEVQLVAGRLAAAGDPIARIVHSGKTRARETAEEIAAVVGGPDAAPEVEQSDDLGPVDDPGPWAGRLEKLSHDVGDAGLILVGHLPYMEKMAGRLTCGDEERLPVRFTKGGILRLDHEGEGQGGWALRWYVTPSVA